MDVKVTRVDFDHEHPERANVDFVIGSTSFQWWKVIPGSSRTYVNPPSRRLNDDSYVDTVVFPAHIQAAVESAVLEAYETALSRQGTAVASPQLPSDDIPF